VNASRTVIRRLPYRRGYALVTVILFNVLFLMLLGVAYRQTASAIRIATVRTEQVHRDEGVVRALARALHMLETGRPPNVTDTNDEYKCYMTFGSGRFFKIKFKLTDRSAETWEVTAAAQSEEPSDSGPKIVDTYLP
jgi:hypothetical protein